MRLETSQIVHAAQVWVCDACGGQDNKSCSCNSTAHQEELAAKREAHRQANRRSYEKTQQKQQSSDGPTDVENVDKSDDESIEAEIDPEGRRAAFLMRADQAARFAVYSGPVDREIAEMARATASAWEGLAQKLSEEANG